MENLDRGTCVHWFRRWRYPYPGFRIRICWVSMVL